MRITLTIFLLLVSGLTIKADVAEKKNIISAVFPVPPHNENSLFYIQRSKNTNAIVYELNRMKDGTPNPEEPVKIYWIRYASDSTTEELNYIQKKYAYGLDVKPYKNQKDSYILQFVSYNKKNIYLLPVGNPSNKKYAAYMMINGKMAELKKVFIALNGGTFWFPTIEYVELTGKDPATNLPVSEKFLPKR